MKIVILKGSPNKYGSSNMLADSFAKGATENGHEIIGYIRKSVGEKTIVHAFAC